jgi:hypothetical protein
MKRGLFSTIGAQVNVRGMVLLCQLCAARMVLVCLLNTGMMFSCWSCHGVIGMVLSCQLCVGALVLSCHCVGRMELSCRLLGETMFCQTCMLV